MINRQVSIRKNGFSFNKHPDESNPKPSQDLNKDDGEAAETADIESKLLSN